MVAPLTDIRANIKAPPEMLDLLYSAYASQIGEGTPNDEAEKAAWRKVQLAGYFKTKQGWKRLGPNLLDKVNVRQAIQQPNGKYLITDVAVFYPNAVKGQDNAWSADRVRRAVENTNRSLGKHGGQAPGLTKGHPHPLRKVLGNGETLPVYGKTMNFRPCPDKPQMVMCDLYDVDEDTYREWADGKFVGLSAGFAEDADDLNVRFGHVALLGADMQALSALPMTEVFGASTVCFCSDSSYVQKGQPMKGSKAYASAMSKAFGALQSAYAAFDAGEPDAETKVEEAKQMCASTHKSFADAGEGKEGHPDAAEDKELIDSILSGKGFEGEETEDSKDEEGEEFDASTASNPSEETALPENPELGTGGGKGPKSSEEVPAATQFATLVKKQFAARDAQIDALTKMVAGLVGRNMKDTFSTEIDALVKDGHQFDAGDALQMLTSAAKSGKGQLELVRKFLRNTPKSPLSGDKTFSASNGGKVVLNNGNRQPQPTALDDNGKNAALKMLQDAFPDRTFSAEDLDLGMVITNNAANQ